MQDEATPTIRQQFLLAMRKMASSVTILTKADPAGAIGMTATAVCSLSADPPAVIVCVNQSASLCSVLDLGEQFAINLLAEGQDELAQCFGSASHRGERFSRGGWRHDIADAPFLEDGMGTLFCTVADLHTFGSHAIVVASVDSIRLSDERAPLLYANGSFTSIQKA